MAAVIYPRESLYTLEKNVFLLLLEREFFIWLLGTEVYSVQIFCFLLKHYLVDLSIIKVRHWIEICYCVTVCFSFPFCQYLLHIFGCSAVRYVYVYNYYIFLVNWSSYYYIMFFFVSYYSVELKVYFVQYKYGRLCFWLPCMWPSFSIFHFQPVYVLIPKVSLL